MSASPAIRQYDYTSDSQLQKKLSSPLEFRPVTLADIPAIRDIVVQSRSMTCDYTIGGIFMWVDYFRYKFCIYEDTLFISGVEENHLDKVAFSCPIGTLPLPRAIELLRDYCKENNLSLRFSAIPADKLICFSTVDPACDVEELADWSDYVYDIESFATLSGKKMSKKRNHVNRFCTDYPDAVLEPVTLDNIEELKATLALWNSQQEADNDASATHDEELREVIDVIDHLPDYGFEGVLLREAPGAKIVAFSFAEIVDNMAFVHIEKMDHTVNGAGETIAHLFADHIKVRHPKVNYLNREEDCGDEGLRRAKESWHPAMLLRKYNVIMES